MTKNGKALVLIETKVPQDFETEAEVDRFIKSMGQYGVTEFVKHYSSKTGKITLTLRTRESVAI